MILTEDQIIQLAKQEKPDKWIHEAREEYFKLIMHVYGYGKDDFLQLMDTLESEDQFKLRQKYAPSNTAVVESLFQPFNSVFTAKGTVIKYGLSNDSLVDKLKKSLSTVKGSLSDKGYMKDIWKYHFLSDPNGLTFVEVKKDGSKAYVTNKSISTIKSMIVDGLVPEYVCFDEVKNEDGSGYTRVVDDAKDYHVIRDSEGNYSIRDEMTIKNSFGRVPAFVNSTIYNTLKGYRVSPIDKQIELLDKYLQNTSNKEILIAKHGYPIYWQYAQYETQKSESNKLAFSHPTDQNNVQEYPTPRSRTLKKDPSSGIIMPPPRSKEDPVIAPNVAGYVSPDVNGLDYMTREQKDTYDQIYHSLWGNYPISKSDGGKTATETLERVHATANKLNDFSSIAERAHKQIIDLFGLYVANNSYKPDDTVVSYSRRHILESPDAILKKYQEAKKNGVNESELDQILINYYESEYSNNDTMIEYCLKIMKLDPFPHLTVSEVLSLNVPESLKQQKLNLKELKNDLSVNDIVSTDYKLLKEKLNNYTNEQNTEELETIR